MNTNQKIYKLSPSSFSFLYEGCKRCFYLSVVLDITQPSIPLPGVFSKIASLLKKHYDGKNTKEVHLALPDGIVSHGEKYVKSKIIEISNHKSACFISGRFDIVTKFNNGSYGVIDFKTGNPKDNYNDLYGRQLRAYSYALENAADGALALAPVSVLGLLYFSPERTKQDNVERLLYETDIHWVKIERDDESFLNFIGEAMSILESDTLPLASPNCLWCNYIEKIRKIK